MKGAMFLGNQEVVVREFPDPQPGPGEAVVRVKMSGVCGNDLHFYRLKEGQAGSGGYVTLPEVIPGHECCGVVEVVGGGVTLFRPGDRVVAHHFLGCGICRFCQRGAPHPCSERQVMGRQFNGSYGQFVVVPERNLQPIPDDLGFMEGALMSCNFGTAFSALKKAKVSGDDTVAVFGLGPVGLCVVMVAAARGAQVIGVDLVPERLGLAQKLGAAEVINGSETDAVEEVKALTGGFGADVTLDVTGINAAQNQALDATGPTGTMVFLGVGDETTIQPMTQLILKDLTVLGSLTYKLGEFGDIAEFITRHRSNFEQLVAGVFTIDQVSDAMHLANTRTAGKVLFRWEQ